MYSYHRLPNGIRIVHRHTPSQVAHCGLHIKTGSRDEEESEQGLAHFIEHVIFKGTRKRKAHHILSRMEHVGGEINAYTSKEETCIHGSFLSSFYERWFELLSDISFGSVFPEKELSKEKEIILDEINAYKDNPAEQIFDDFDGLVFGDHPLGRNILGEPVQIKKFNRNDVLDFIARNYSTEEMVIASVGNIPFQTLIDLSVKYFGDIPHSSPAKSHCSPSRIPAREKIVLRPNHQAHCIIGNPSYGLNHKKKTPMLLLNNMLGGPGMNCRLNMAVREKYGFCYHIESNYLAHSDSGLFSIYFGTDPGYVEKTLSIISRELLKLKTHKLGTLQLSRAKQQMIGQMAIAFESNVSEMLSMGKSVLFLDKVDSMEKMILKIEAITASQLLDVAGEMLDPVMMSKLMFKPC